MQIFAGPAETNASTMTSVSQTTTATPQADLSAKTADSPDPLTAGTDLTYTVTVNTAGPSDALMVQLSDPLPTGTTLVSIAIPAGWTRTDATPVCGTGTITWAAAGGSSHVKVFDQALTERQSFFAFDSLSRGGVFVAAGDLDGDGRAELVVGSGAGTTTEVKVFNLDGAAGAARGSIITQNPDVVRAGVRVALVDRFADGKLDILTGAGPASPPAVQVFDGVFVG